MRSLIDAQLPRRFAGWLDAAGYDTVPALNVPRGNRTAEAEVTAAADRDGRVIVTMDADLVNAHLLYGRPAKLPLISTGNLTNVELERLVVPAIPTLVRELSAGPFVELGRSGLIVRG